LLQLWPITGERFARAAKVSIVVNGDAGASKRADRRNLVSVSSQLLALFSATHAEKAAPELTVLVKAGSAG
jgi:hypothetical protein